MESRLAAKMGNIFRPITLFIVLIRKRCTVSLLALFLKALLSPILMVWTIARDGSLNKRILPECVKENNTGFFISVVSEPSRGFYILYARVALLVKLR